jgi:hypothetical protein
MKLPGGMHAPAPALGRAGHQMQQLLALLSCSAGTDCILGGGSSVSVWEQCVLSPSVLLGSPSYLVCPRAWVLAGQAAAYVSTILLCRADC